MNALVPYTQCLSLVPTTAPAAAYDPDALAPAAFDPDGFDPVAFDPAAFDPAFVDIVEFELAIGFLDFSAGDFETVLRPALAARGAALLFVLPCPVMQNASRLAAVSLGPARQIVLVVLDATGTAARVEQPATENPFAGLAASFTRVMERLPLAE